MIELYSLFLLSKTKATIYARQAASLIEDNDLPFSMTGLERNPADNSWIWADGSQVSFSIPWAGGQPENKDFGALGKDGLFYAMDSSDEMSFICTQEAQSSCKKCDVKCDELLV